MFFIRVTVTVMMSGNSSAFHTKQFIKYLWYVPGIRFQKWHGRNHYLPRNRVPKENFMPYWLLSSENPIHLVLLLILNIVGLPFPKLYISQGFGEGWAENQHHFYRWPSTNHSMFVERKNSAERAGQTLVVMLIDSLDFSAVSPGLLRWHCGVQSPCHICGIYQGNRA